MSPEFRRFSKMLKRVQLKRNLTILLQPTLEVQENDPGISNPVLVLSIRVPNVLTGEKLTIVSSIALRKEHLPRSKFNERVYKLLKEALTHEIDEGLVIDQKNYTDPHPPLPAPIVANPPL
jgi:hypothetical protein